MSQFRATGAILTLVVIGLVCLLGLFGATLLQAAWAVVSTAGFYQLMAVMATGFLGGVVSGLKTRLPNFGGRPPVSALRESRKAPALAACAALLLGLGAAFLLAASPDLPRLRVLALNAALGLNIGMLLRCLWICFKMTRQYRADCAWEDLVHPRSA